MSSSPPLTIARRDTLLAAALSVASLTLWFGLGFPWEHHNESLVWVTDMAGKPWVDAFSWHPIRPVQTWRPLGVAMAWFSVAWTQGIWLQQLLNFVVTVAAWWLAVRASNARLPFGLATALALAGFFSPYIYLFHLHGVFYGPLLVFLAWLLVLERESVADAGWRPALHLLLISVVAASFHTFALLLFAAYIGANWLEASWRLRRISNLVPTVVTVLAAAVLTRWLVAESTDLGSADPVLGILTSYRALELNVLLSLLAGLFAAIAAAVAGWVDLQSRRAAAGLAALALAVAAAFYLLGLPVVFAWILVAGIRALFQQRLRLLALLGVCALLPVVTSTGSPTYTVFVLMPCLLLTVDGLVIPERRLPLLRGLGLAAAAGSLVLLVLLKLGVPVPVIDGLARPLRAEGEKTHQMKAALDWLAGQPELSGHLSLCTPADFPIRSGHPLDRALRAPTGDWPLEQYLHAHHGERLSRADQPALGLCFGNDHPEGAKVLQAWPGQWAGEATLVLMPPA